MLYSINREFPTSLPFRIRLSDGRTRTDPTTFTSEEIAKAGYVLAPDRPTYDSSTHALTWDGEAWATERLPDPPAIEPYTRKLSRFEFMSLMTGSERQALRKRAKSDPIIADALDMLTLAAHVDCVPMHSFLAQMLGYVQQIGIMSAERRAAFVEALTEAAK